MLLALERQLSNRPYIEHEDCRICGSRLRVLANFGDQPLGSRFPRADEPEPPRIPLVVCRCPKCELIQLGHTVDGIEIWREGYGYASGVNETMRAHLADIVQSLDGPDVKTVLDIGCNDGTLLRNWEWGTTRIGFDPTAELIAGVTVVPDYFTAAEYHRLGLPLADRVTSIAMFYDLDDPVGFARDVMSVMQPRGVWCLEVGHIGAIADGAWDTICHEHVAYYGLKQIRDIADRVGLKINNVLFNDINGGSIQVWLSRFGWFPLDVIDTIIERENKLSFGDFGRDVNLAAKNIRRCIQEQFRGKRVYALGASTKGNTLLQLSYLNKDHIAAAVDRNPDKVGRRLPGSGIPIISEEECRADPPDAFLVLPWHFKDQLLEREKELRAKGVKFIFPLPELEIC